ncbi:hypothetical protein [Methylocystis sp. Sn-Cys]|uniref:hypothetical protein n=1 Tax=Methylocystis sp. Sn-Cys TaxID=1701263 RepID=UPI001923FC1D|nr:hypothetical protein [Methylocystis sp. Sn-Cys]MBL1256181.1 hypothetical protein [Methylocystis sp. Sn-Cys]
MWNLFTIFFSFVLTAVIGNFLAAGWQYRNWIAQQKVSVSQKKNEEQMALLDEIERLASSRRFHMARFAYSLETDDDELIKSRFTEFDKTLVQWNERYSAFLAKLRIYRTFDDAIRLETRIHTPLSLCTSDLAALHKKDKATRFEKIRKLKIHARLNTINGEIIDFSRDYLTEISRNSVIVIDPDSRDFKFENLHYFTTLFLLKSLFRERQKYF